MRNIPCDKRAPEDVAEAVSFLASPRSRVITGQTLILDDGLTAQVRTSGLAEQAPFTNHVISAARAAV
ncbi:SDR family oxidoreductase [Bradyrhizobium sp. 142]|uniref:SDR family oxidoreductase n=1 Tax=Bradyrhizobium sp. 142 TaxID=2782618 RepID=UPI00201C9E42|nr:SDR family oxidoreductase [Bradyrhizobium sp. 142]MCK1725452.1 SDR family oxidoreductase [Bradyrhizobium sp. 142]